MAAAQGSPCQAWSRGRRGRPSDKPGQATACLPVSPTAGQLAVRSGFGLRSLPSPRPLPDMDGCSEPILQRKQLSPEVLSLSGVVDGARADLLSQASALAV